MRFSALFTLGLATAAIATPTKVQRDVGPVKSVIASISDKTDALASAISGYSGGDPSSVEQASADLISTIKSGVETVNGNGDLTSSDALALTSPVQDLTDKVESTIDSLIGKKEEFVAADAGGTVLESLNAQYDAADSLAKAISSKVPEALADLASELSAGITAAIQKGIDAYKDAGSSKPTESGSKPTATKTDDSEPTATETDSETTAAPTTSSPVIPTGGSETSSSAAVSTPVETGSGSPTETSPPVFTGAASKAGFSFGGAIAAAALVAAF